MDLETISCSGVFITHFEHIQHNMWYLNLAFLFFQTLDARVFNYFFLLLNCICVFLSQKVLLYVLLTYLLFKVKIKSSRKKCEICPSYWRWFCFFIAIFEILQSFFYSVYCWLWIDKYLLGMYVCTPTGLPLEYIYSLQYQQQQQNNELQTGKMLPIHD